MSREERTSLPPDIQAEFVVEQREKRRGTREKQDGLLLPKVTQLFHYLEESLENELDDEATLARAKDELRTRVNRIHLTAEEYIIARIQHIRMGKRLMVDDPQSLNRMQVADRRRSRAHDAFIDALFDATQYTFQRVVEARRQRGEAPPVDRVDPAYADLLDRENGRYRIGQYAIEYCFHLIEDQNSPIS